MTHGNGDEEEDVEDGDGDYYDEDADVVEDDFEAHHFFLSLHHPVPFSTGPLRSHHLVVRMMKITILVIILRMVIMMMVKRVTIILMVSMIHDYLYDGFDHPRPFLLWFAIPASHDTVPFPFCPFVDLSFCHFAIFTFLTLLNVRHLVNLPLCHFCISNTIDDQYMMKI